MRFGTLPLVPPRTSLLFTFRLIPAISAILARKGIDAGDLLCETGLPAEALRGEITAPLHRIQALIELTAKRLGTELFGLDLAAGLPGGAYGTAEFLVRSAPNVEASLQAISEFAALINPIGQFRYVAGDAAGRLHYTVASERDTLGAHLNEFTISYTVRQFSAVLERPLPLTEVWFSHTRKSSADEVARRFGCPVRFQAADCGFAVAREALAIVPRTADPLLFQFLHQQARAQLARVGPVDIVSQLVRVLETRLPSGDLGAEAVARAMATTSRSLQRHLAEAGTTYRDVLIHIRSRRRAELRGGGVAEAEIAKQLGFSDARAMRRSLDDDA